MEQLQIFSNSEFGEVRTVTKDNEPMFCLADVCKALEIKNVSDCRSRLNEKGIAITDTLTNGGKQKMTFINEANLYKVIFQSRKDSAERFTDWVTFEVLPSIRKNGGYIAGQETLSDDELMAKALLVAQNKLAEREEKIKELETSVQQMDKVICEMTPKVDYVDRILSSNECLTVTQIAQDYGMSAKRLNKILQNLHIQRKVGEQWILYAEHQGKGYVKSKTHDFDKLNGGVGTKQLTVWTQKGRMFLYEELKKVDVLPSMEVA